MVESAEDVDDVSCSWHSVCVIRRGVCYVCDVTSSLCHCVCVSHLSSAARQLRSPASDCAQLIVNQPSQLSTLMHHDDDDDDDDGVGGGDMHADELTEHFSAVETNDKSTFVITTDRNLVSIERDGDSYSVLRELSGFKVIAVSCGQSHSLVLSAIGVVFSSGLGSQGQLGHGGLESECSLRVIEALEGVRMRRVCAGGWHSMALSDSDDVYVWGWNETGQLGLRCLSVNNDMLHSQVSHAHDTVRILLFVVMCNQLSHCLHCHAINTCFVVSALCVSTRDMLLKSGAVHESNSYPYLGK